MNLGDAETVRISKTTHFRLDSYLFAKANEHVARKKDNFHDLISKIDSKHLVGIDGFYKDAGLVKDDIFCKIRWTVSGRRERLELRRCHDELQSLWRFNDLRKVL